MILTEKRAEDAVETILAGPRPIPWEACLEVALLYGAMVAALHDGKLPGVDCVAAEESPGWGRFADALNLQDGGIHEGSLYDRTWRSMVTEARRLVAKRGSKDRDS